jgi:hypothetical protein
MNKRIVFNTQQCDLMNGDNICKIHNIQLTVKTSWDIDVSDVQQYWNMFENTLLKLSTM